MKAPTRFDLLRAVRAVRALIDDPDDTAQAFRVVDALAGRAPARNLARFAATEVGARVLAERRSLMVALGDRARLAALPDGSLGRAYLQFMEDEGITADGLVDASVAGAERPEIPSSDLDFFQSWLRDSHDLWHTVTGYQGDLVGEAALLAFSFAQTRHPGVGLIVFAALVRASPLGRALGALRHDPAPAVDVDGAVIRRMIVQGFVRGLRAAWLPAQDWEALLAEPLVEVRRRLALDEPAAYVPIRTRDLEPARAAA